MIPEYRPGEAFARQMDDQDPLGSFRTEFEIPKAADIAALAGRHAPPGDSMYLCGNSLGCMPRKARDLLHAELDDWSRLAVESHTHGRNPWLPYHEQFRGPLSRLVGASEREVVAMNTLTANLHLLMISFYRPTRERFKIVIEDSAFPSDSYAVTSQAGFHAAQTGFDPQAAIIRVKARPGEHTLRTEDIIQIIEREGNAVALVMLGAVNYLTGQWFDMAAITRAAHLRGCVVGWDLAHAVGNVPMSLHDWNVDFAAWCSYKYLNGGPGAVAGAYVHERHLADPTLPRLAGWWGNDPATRFRMGPEFSPTHSADAWALSNPPIFSLTPLIASFELFDRATMPALRAKSLALTGYLEWSIDRLNATRPGSPIQVITPRDPARRGCHLSLVFADRPRAALEALRAAGAVCDFREPNIIRLAPVPLYNTFTDVYRVTEALGKI